MDRSTALARTSRKLVLTLLCGALVSAALTPPAGAAGPSGPGRYENASAAISLRGSWDTLTSASDSAGTSASLSVDGYAELNFNATGVRWGARTNNFSGIAEVYLDGVKQTSVDLYSPSTKYRQTAYEVSGLPEGAHTLRIVRTGSKSADSTGRNINVDYLEVLDIEPPSAPADPVATLEKPGARLTWSASPEPDVTGYRVYRQVGSSDTMTRVTDGLVDATGYLDDGLQPGTTYRYQVAAVDAQSNESPRSTVVSVSTPINAVGDGTYENDSSAVTRSGPWTTTASSSDSGGSVASLSSAGYAELSFTTSGVRLVARTNSYSGKADVYLDGVKKATVDLYSASTKTRQTVYEVTDLADSPHTIRVVRTGARNASSTGGAINVDAFVAPDLQRPAPPEDVTVSLGGTAAQLTWAPSPDRDVRVYRVLRTEASTGTAEMVGTTSSDVLTFSDDGLAPGSSVQYQVAAVDTSDNESEYSSPVELAVPIAAQGAGTYENDSPAVTLNGPWTKSTSASDSGGSFSSLTTAGYAELSFKTSGIRWIARTNSYSGMADVYIDGVKKATVDLYSSTTKYRQTVYEVSGLPEVAHTIRVVRTGARNASSSGGGVILDAFVAPDVYPPAAPTTPQAVPEKAGVRVSWAASPESDVVGYRVYRQEGTTGTRTSVSATPITVTSYVDSGLQPGTLYRYQVTALDAGGNESAPTSVVSATTAIAAVGQGTYENDSAAVTLNGPWTTSASSSDSGGSTSTLTSTGHAQLSFKTSGIRWIARTNSYSGMADVYIDGVKKATVDLYSATSRTRQTVYEATGLSESAHTIRVVRTGARNASATGGGINLDAFVAPDVHAPAAPTGLKAVLEGTGAKLTWSANPEPDLQLYRVYRRTGSVGANLVVGTVPAGTTTFSDPGLEPGMLYRYQVVALDSSDNASALSTVAELTMPITAQGAGTYEHDSSAVTLSGGWTTMVSGSDSGGSFGQLAASGYAQLSFRTSGIRWIARTNSYSGIADVYIDGVKKASVDLYSATTKYQQVVYEISGLPETAHTIRIVRTGTKNPSASGATIILDAFVAPDIYPPSAPTQPVATPERTGARVEWAANPEADVVGYRLYRRVGTSEVRTSVRSTPITTTSHLDDGLEPGTTYQYQVAALDAGGNESPLSAVATVTTTINAVGNGIYEDDSPSVTRSGTWTRTTSSSDSGGGFSSLSTTGHAQLSFTTSGIRWVTRTNSYSGIADVYLDGVKRATVDLYSSTTKYQQTVYEISGLPETNHTLRVVRTGTRNAGSSSANITLDAFVAPDIYAPAGPQGLRATAARTGAALSWTASPQRDVASYRVYRSEGAGRPEILVGTTSADVTTFTDVGLADATNYRWTVVARDTSDNDSPPSVAATYSTPAEAIAGTRRYASCPTATETVSTRAELVIALAAAAPGDVIRLNPGSYGGKYDVEATGTDARPVWICGPRTAVFDYGATNSGYGFKIESSAHVVLAGMTVRNVQKGVAVNGSQSVTVADLRLENIGDEAIHVKETTVDSMVVGNSISGTGLNDPTYGEGVYIGTAQSNWCLYTNCLPDRSDRNSIVLNTISNTTAESIEAKAGTQDGLIARNTLDGTGMVAEASDSLIGILGAGWVVAKNTGSNTPLDGIQVWEGSDGWGRDNIVYANSLTQGVSGYGVRLPYNGLGNIVGCDNLVVATSWGLSNKTCQP